MDALRPVDGRQGGEREDCGADDEGGATRERAEAVEADEHSRRGEPVEREQRGHDRERCPDEDGARVVAARADDRERDGCGGRGDGGEPDAVEVDESARVGFLSPDEDEGGRRERDAGGADRAGPSRFAPAATISFTPYRPRTRSG